MASDLLKQKPHPLKRVSDVMLDKPHVDLLRFSVKVQQVQKTPRPARKFFYLTFRIRHTASRLLF